MLRCPYNGMSEHFHSSERINIGNSEQMNVWVLHIISCRSLHFFYCSTSFFNPWKKLFDCSWLNQHPTLNFSSFLPHRQKKSHYSSLFNSYTFLLKHPCLFVLGFNKTKGKALLWGCLNCSLAIVNMLFCISFCPLWLSCNFQIAFILWFSHLSCVYHFPNIRLLLFVITCASLLSRSSDEEDDRAVKKNIEKDKPKVSDESSGFWKVCFSLLIVICLVQSLLSHVNFFCPEELISITNFYSERYIYV